VVTVTGHTGDAANVAMNQVFTVAAVTSPTIAVLTGTGMTIGTYNTGTISGAVTTTPSDGSIFSTATKECSCGTTNGQPNRLVERDAYTNELFPYKKCMACPSKSVVLAPLQNPYLCRPCPHRNMTYDIETFACKCEPSSIFETVGLSFYGPQSCIYKNELYQGSQNAEASSLKYWTVQDVADYSKWPPQTGIYTKGTPVESIVFKHYLMQAASRCAYFGEAEDLQYCEQLANLCVLTLYDKTSKACQILSQIQNSNRPTVTGFTGWKQTIPYLQFDAIGTAATSVKLDMTMSFDQTAWLGTYESLNFTLAAYSLNGTFLGFEQLTDQFQWCKKKIQSNSSRRCARE
jgi:meckelin